MYPETTELPLFPLHTVLYPGGLLPLQIFEVRYLDLMQRCERTGEPFGVVCLRSGAEVRRAPTPGQDDAPPAETLAEVGTLATLREVSRPQAGLMLVQVLGGQRFTLQSARLLPHGLWMGQVSPLPDDAPSHVPDELLSLAPRLQQVWANLNPETLPPATDLRWQDAGWLANRWAECLPLPTAERQRLMVLDNPMWRLELVAEWLDRLMRADGQAGLPPAS
jgi:Lon protease-like protein